MRGDIERQRTLFSYVDTESRVPLSHPLRAIKRIADEILKRLSPMFDGLYDERGKRSVPPEVLLKSLLLQALFTVRSERLLCEMLEYNLLFRWFLDLAADGATFDHSTLSRNRKRLLEHEVAQEFFEEVVRYAREKKLLGDERFTVDSSQIEAWASLKSFRPKERNDDPDDDGSNFHRQQRTNETHRSTTDPDAKLFRKGNGKEAKLSFNLHTLNDSKHNLAVAVELTPAGTRCEWEAATRMLDRHRDVFDVSPRYVTGDKNYYQQVFIDDLRERNIIPHIAVRADIAPRVGMDRRTVRHATYRRSQHVRKFIEHPFGWMKTTGLMRKPKFRGVQRVSLTGILHLAFFNVLRIAKLVPA